MDTRYILLFLCTLCVISSGVKSWLFSNTHNDVDAVRDDLSQAADSVRPSSPFEINTADDKFLLEASIARELSALDACHHRVVSELEGRCGDLTEEELAKLSVRLFNCQAAVEERQTYSCTSDMAIADCTRDMDSTTWNAYQIVSNRARSVCYSMRQQHFRARAEQTVNKLMTSSEQQLHTLASISETQQQLKFMADSTIEQLETGHRQIVNDQQQLRQAHQSMNSQVLRNLHHIQQEKEVIIAGNKLLIRNTEQIQEKLDSTSEQMSEQADVQLARHKELLHDLTQLDTQAKDVSSKLDESMMVVEKFQRSVIEHQQDAIENLKHINNTVNFVLSLLNSVRDVVEVKLEWILHVTGATDIRMAVMSVAATHFCYAVVVMILSLLLRAKWHICCLLLTFILLNAAAELRFNSGLVFTQLAAVILAVSFVACFIPRCWAIAFHHPPPAELVVADRAKCDQTLSSDDISYIVRALEQLSADFKRRISGSDKEEEEDMANVRVASSTPTRRLPELGFSSLSNRSKSSAGSSLLDYTPPPIRRHVLPVTPSNPPPTPVINQAASLMNASGLLQLPLLDSADGSRSSSPAGSTPCSASLRRKSRASTSLNRSFNRPPCIAMTKSGQGCKLPAQDGSSFCHRHQLTEIN